jgi:hypothetical protein
MHLAQDVSQWRNREQNETSFSGKGEEIFSPVSLCLLQTPLKNCLLPPSYNFLLANLCRKKCRKNTAESFYVVICVSPSLNCVHAWEANDRSVSHLLGSFLFSNAIRSFIQLLTREHVGVQSTFIDMMHSYCVHCCCIQITVTTDAVALHTSLRDNQGTLFRCLSVPVSWTSNGFSSLHSDQI